MLLAVNLRKIAGKTSAESPEKTARLGGKKPKATGPVADEKPSMQFTRSISLNFTALALLTAGHALAGADTVPLQPFHFTESGENAVVAETPLLVRGPYLALVGPTSMRFANPDEPVLRQPPLLPKIKKPVLDAAKQAEAKAELAKVPTPSEDNILSTASPSISTAPPPPKPAEPASAPDADAPGNALTPSADDRGSLSDAVIYFNAPNQHRSPNATLEVPVPQDPPPPTVTQPSSSATYESK